MVTNVDEWNRINQKVGTSSVLMVAVSISRISTEPFSGAKLTTAADFMVVEASYAAPTDVHHDKECVKCARHLFTWRPSSYQGVNRNPNKASTLAHSTPNAGIKNGS